MTQPQLVYTKESQVEIATIATSAVLIDVHVSTWTGRKRDKKTTQEVNDDKQTTTNRAASVIKNLMCDDKELDAIRAYAQDTRLWLHKNTLAWHDNGTRLLPSAAIFDVTSELEARITEFETRVKNFVVGYPVKISAAAFKLGQLFDRNEFPDGSDIARRFSMRYVISPVPTAGDFRVDVQKDVGEILQKQYAAEADRRIVAMLREPWERVFDTLTHIQERMEVALAYEPGVADNGRKKPKLFQSLLDNGLDLVALLEKLNISKDPQLSDCAARMRRMLTNVDIKSLRESKDLQQSVKKQVDEILGAFDFGGFEGE